jgi:tripartite-type tricarboxylate transporter receptor subunit TctC
MEKKNTKPKKINHTKTKPVFLQESAEINDLEVAKKIQDAMTKAMQRTELRDKLLAQGLDLTPIANEKLVDYLRLELGRWARIVKVSGAMVD